MVVISTSSNSRQRAVSARHAVLEELIALARQQVEGQLAGLVLRLTQCLLDGSAVVPEAVQARLRAGNDLRQRQYAFLSVASSALEQLVRREMAALAPLRPARTVAAQALSLVSLDEMDQQLALANLARSYDLRHAAVLQSLNGGLARLFQRDTLRLAQNPLRPEVFLAAMRQAWDDFAGDDSAALRLDELCQPQLFLDLAPILQALNTCLQGHLAHRPDSVAAPVAVPDIRVEPLPQAAFAADSGAKVAGPPRQPLPTTDRAGEAELAQKLRQFFAAASADVAEAGQSGTRAAASAPNTTAGAGLAGAGAVSGLAAPSSLLAYLAQWPQVQLPPHAPSQSHASLQPASQADAGTSTGTSTGAQILYLPQIKAGLPRGSLSHAEAGAIDLLSAVFESVFRDDRMAQEIRQLVLLLQIPVLKAALADREFFFQDSHPARKLIDLLSRLGWEQRVQPDAARLQAMQRSVERVGRDSAEESAAFARAVDELEATLAVQEQQETEQIATPIASALKQEKALVARRQAEAALAARLEQGDVLALVRDFLSQRWIEVLAFAYRVEDEKSGAIDHATCAMDELLWSVQPKLNVHERKRLLLRLPALLGALNKWLDLVQWQGEERTRFFADLAECHASIVRAPLEMPPERQLELAIAAGTADAARLAAAQNGALAASAAAQLPLSTVVATLQRGMWLEFDAGHGAPQQVKLAWVSPLRSLYIFATASRQEAYSLSADELARRFDAGTVRIICDPGVVSGALGRALAQAA